MNLLKRLERTVDEKLRRLFTPEQSAAQGKELLEVQRALLEEVAARAETLPRGKRVFPYDRLTVSIPVPDPDRRVAFGLVFESSSTAQEIREYLKQDGIAVPDDFAVDVRLLEEPLDEVAPSGFHVRYEKAATVANTPRSTAAATPRVRLTVMDGETVQPEFSGAKARVNIGRLHEVLDDSKRVMRRNDIAFADRNEPPNSTVSRMHAHIEYAAAAGEHRLFDDGSAYGTSVLRDGRLLSVPAGGRGVKLSSGDEIYIGQARVRFEVGDPDATEPRG